MHLNCTELVKKYDDKKVVNKVRDIIDKKKNQ